MKLSDKLKAFAEDRSAASSLGAGLIVMGVVVILIGVIMFPLVDNTIQNIKTTENATGATIDDPNVTGTEETLLDAIPIFYLLGVLLGGIAMMILPILEKYK